MKFLNLLLILFLIASCANRDQEDIWDRLRPDQQAAIQTAANAACLTTTASLINTLKTNSTAGLLDLAEGDYFKLTNGETTVDIVVLNQGTTDSDPDYNAPNTVFFFVRKGSIKSLPLYPVVSSTEDYIYKVTTTNNDAQWDEIQKAMCNKGTNTAGETLVNTFTDSTTNFNYTLRLEDVTGDGQEADISSYKFSILSTLDLPAFFQFFNVEYKFIERNESGTEVTNSDVSTSYSLTAQSSQFPDLNTDAFEDDVQAATRCEYASISPYDPISNVGIKLPLTTSCSENRYKIRGWD